MQIKRLDHVNLRTTQLESMIGRYVDVLGLHNCPRPDFPFPGAWLYAGEAAIVHLDGITDAAAGGSDVAVKLKHCALSATRSNTIETSWKAQTVTFRKSGIPDLGMVAFNLWDPDGNHIHVDFKDTQ